MFRIKNSIQSRLIGIFLLLTMIVVGASGFFLYWKAKTSLESELGKKLIAVAGSVASQIDGQVILNLQPGDEDSRTYRNIQRRLDSIRERTEVKRIYLFNRALQSIVDSEGMEIGKEYTKLRFDEAELNLVWRGNPTSSVLFEGIDGLLYKSGYSPVWVQDTVQAAVGVDGSATFLASITNIRKSIFMIGIFSVVLGVIVAIVFSSTIVNPVKKLVVACERLGSGNYQHPIELKSSTEIGFLAKTMDEMRSNIIRRDGQLKTMLAGVAHEIRNPLGGIEIFADLISQELKEGSEQKKRVENIIKEVKNLKRIVNDFLEYARPSIPKRVPYRISVTCEEVFSLVSQDLKKHNIEMIWEEESEETCVLADPQHLKQVFLNLVSNSIHAMPEGGTITIKIKQFEKEFMAIDFEDTGEGISPEIAERLFDPFVTTRKEGTGLGLAIVQKLVEDNRGQIEAYGEDKKGLKFKIILPKG
jgi:two-component system OmpR family sensor kinase